MTIPKLISWKIEGRKKGPHYVYHVAAAYRLLCDHPGDSQAKKEAEELLARALSRPRTKAGILPHRPYSPVQPEGETSSGLLAGAVLAPKGRPRGGPRGAGGGRGGKAKFKARMELMPGDFLRVGYVDQPWHHTTRVNTRIKKGGMFILNSPPQKRPKPGTAVFLIDRRGPELVSLLDEWEAKLQRFPGRQPAAVEVNPRFAPAAPGFRPVDQRLARSPKAGKAGQANALWLSAPALKQTSRGSTVQVFWWAAAGDLAR